MGVHIHEGARVTALDPSAASVVLHATDARHRADVAVLTAGVWSSVLARTAGVLANHAGSQISTTTALPLPDFAFERNGVQNTLSQVLKTGPVLVVLFAKRAPLARLEQLARLQPRLAAAGLHVVAVGLGPSTHNAPPIVEASQDVRVALALFRSPTDGGETELMLDRGANVRARWTASGASGLADAGTLLSYTARVASIPVAAANHAGHAH